MPIYTYACEACENQFDHLAKSMAASDDKVACPVCGSRKTGRKMSVFAVSGAAASTGGSAGGHTHSGMCGCGRAPGSCGMN